MGVSKLLSKIKEWAAWILIKLLEPHSSDISESDFEDIFLSEEDIICHLRFGNYVIQTTKGYYRFIPQTMVILYNRS